MSERDFAMALAMLAEAFGEKHLTPVRIEAYHRALKDIPLPLLNAAVRRAITARTWFPKVAELRTDAEACRRELIAAHPYQGCVECEDSRGFRAVLRTKTGELTETLTVERCPCHKRHQELMAGFGVTAAPLALPAAEEPTPSWSGE